MTGTPPSFPLTAANVAWPVRRTPTFSTAIASHVSGRETRLPRFSYPLYAYELTIEALDQYSQAAGLGFATYQALRGLYETLQGQFGTFLYTDPGDSVVSQALQGTGDGETSNFQLIRTIGGAVAPVGWVMQIANVYLNGGVIAANQYTLIQPNTLSFNSPPNNGVQIAVDMTYAWLCRFMTDSQEFDEFMNGYHSLDSLKFRTVKL